ncbi:MAG: hypothetical protein A2277_01805 [Desulfobacterales bacterium RIFOXYA12_FULL_46_15]|nr:MAG: hypothetical protein A2277_01805 [Desulfobacterales bacterium RIFOXYA12_FULL_46_15]
MLYVYPNFGTVLFLPEVIKTFLKFQQKMPEDKEAGGYLLGKLFDKQLVIEVATEPGLNDLRNRYFVMRNRLIGNKILSKLWRRSKGELFLAGEWHTHPESKPSPSAYDRTEIIKSFTNNYYPLKFMSVAIIGNGPIAKTWIGIQNSSGLSSLNRGGYQLWNL